MLVSVDRELPVSNTPMHTANTHMHTDTPMDTYTHMGEFVYKNAHTRARAHANTQTFEYLLLHRQFLPGLMPFWFRPNKCAKNTQPMNTREYVCKIIVEVFGHTKSKVSSTHVRTHAGYRAGHQARGGGQGGVAGC